MRVGWELMAIDIEAANVSTLQLLADDRLVERLHFALGLGNCASEKLELSISSANWCRMPTNEALKGETAGHLLKIMSFSTPRRSEGNRLLRNCSQTHFLF